MKKLLCCFVLLMVAMTISAMSQMRAYAPPGSDDSCQMMVATLSVDGQAVAMFDSQMNVMDLQTPPMPQEVGYTSAQVVYAQSVATMYGEVSVTLANYRWPIRPFALMRTQNT